jgi:chaperonin GroEL (HSP60 family)
MFYFFMCRQCTDTWQLGSSSDPATFRQDLFNIARTTLSSKVLAQDKDYFANLAVDAVLRLKVCVLDVAE